MYRTNRLKTRLGFRAATLALLVLVACSLSPASPRLRSGAGLPPPPPPLSATLIDIPGDVFGLQYKRLVDTAFDGTIAVAISHDEETNFLSTVHSFNPETGAILDQETVGFFPLSIQTVERGSSVFVVAATVYGGPSVTILSLADSGQMSFIAQTQLETQASEFYSNIVVAPSGLTAFMFALDETVWLPELIAFNVADGQIVSKTTLDGWLLGDIAIADRSGSQFIVYQKGIFPGTLSILDVTDPELPLEVGSVPVSGAPKDVAAHPEYCVTADGRYVFYCDPTLNFTVVDIDARSAVASLPNSVRYFDPSLSENGLERWLVARAIVEGDPYDFEAIAVLNLSDPTAPNPVTVSEREIGPASLRISNSGTQAYLATVDGVRGLAVPSLVTVWEYLLPQDQAWYHPNRIVVSGTPERILMPWWRHSGIAGDRTFVVGSFVPRQQSPITLTCPPAVSVPAASIQGEGCAFGATVSYPPPVVVGGNFPETTCAPPSGSFFPVGSTTVTCVSIDGSGDRGECSFVVTVQSPYVAGAFVCLLGDGTGDSFTEIVDSTSPLFGAWTYRVSGTNETFCGIANRTTYAAGRSLISSDTDDSVVGMSANIRFSGSGTGTVIVTDKQTRRRFVLRDRSLADNTSCSEP